jgi:hypothetical protein
LIRKKIKMTYNMKRKWRGFFFQKDDLSKFMY